MKLIRTASSTKVIISKDEWINIGKKSGWIKEARLIGKDIPSVAENIDINNADTVPRDTKSIEKALWPAKEKDPLAKDRSFATIYYKYTDPKSIAKHGTTGRRMNIQRYISKYKILDEVKKALSNISPEEKAKPDMQEVISYINSGAHESREYSEAPDPDRIMVYDDEEAKKLSANIVYPPGTNDFMKALIREKALRGAYRKIYISNIEAIESHGKQWVVEGSSEPEIQEKEKQIKEKKKQEVNTTIAPESIPPKPIDPKISFPASDQIQV